MTNDANNRSIVSDLRRLVGDDRVLDTALHEDYVRDRTGKYVGHSPAVVMPGSPTEIAEILTYCNERAIAVVPQGGNTGLVGGGVPCDGEIVLSLRRLTGVSEHERGAEEGILKVKAGSTLGETQTVLAAAGDRIPIDLGARDSATLGGMASTNAGGSMSFRFGRMTHLVVGATVVTADGTTIDGDEGMWLSTGLEGTACVVTELDIRTRPRPRTTATVLASFGSVEQACAVAISLKNRLQGLVAAEYMAARSVLLTERHLGRKAPVRLHREHLLLLEVEDTTDEEITGALIGCDDLQVAQSVAQSEALWTMRDLLNETLHVAGPPLKLDVRVAAERAADFLAWVESLEGAHAFGHVLEGNLHVNLLDVRPEDQLSTARAVITSAIEHGGRVVGEHGAGRTKKPLLDLEPETDALERFHTLKRRYDPNTIMNPALIVPVYENP